MTRSLAEYMTAIPDLQFPLALHRVGTCPACGNYGMTLKLLELPLSPGEELPERMYEPFCPHGCGTERIDQAVTAQLDHVHLEVG
jgi:hypothetical protein